MKPETVLYTKLVSGCHECPASCLVYTGKGLGGHHVFCMKTDKKIDRHDENQTIPRWCPLRKKKGKVTG